MPRHLLYLCFALVCLFQGCASYTEKSAALVNAWERGDLNKASKLADDLHADSPERDRLLTALESGSVKLAAGNLDGSISVFNEAETRMADYDERAKISVSGETMSLFYNQTILPYKGFDYERIMVNVYKSLDYMQKGDMEGARVELRRAYNRQVDAVENNRKRISGEMDEIRQTQKKSAENGTSYDATRATQDPEVKRQLESIYGDLNTPSPYGDYVNPFAEYLRGIFLMWNSTGASDSETARKSLEKTITLVPNNSYVLEDFKRMNSGQTGEFPNSVYVLFETGMAPTREEMQINIPLFVVTDKVPYVGVALPVLKPRGNFDPQLYVNAGGQVYTAELIADMDAIITRDFNNHLTVVVLRSVLSAGAKATAQYFATRQIKDDDWRLVANIIGMIAQWSVNKADLRSWRTLPKQFQICRVAMPENMQIGLAVSRTGETINVNLPKSKACIVYVKSISNRSPLIVQTIILKP